MNERVRVRARGTLCLLALLTATALAAAEAPGEGKAMGAFSVDGKPFSFGYAYAQMEKDSEDKDVLSVLLTEQAVPAGLLNGDADLGEVLQAAKLNGLVFRVDAKNEASDWSWVHPALSIGCGYCSELKLESAKRTKTSIQGSVRTSAPQHWQKQRYEFKASFDARILAPKLAPGTPAQEAARKAIRKAGLRYNARGFFAGATEPGMVKTFLDAGMAPDTVSPDDGETLLLYILGFDCTNPAVRDGVLALLKAGGDPNKRSADGSVPLLRGYACADVVDALLTASADMKAASPIQGESVGQTLMGNAVTFDKPEVVRLLIRRGYDVKTDAARLLDHARGRPEIERILHEAGAVAPPRAAPARRAAGSAPAHLPPPAPHKALSPDEARQALRGRNVDLSTDKTMLDAFLTAVMHQDDETALLFLDAGVSPNARREPPQNDTPLLAAVFGGCKAADPAQNARMEALIAAMLAKGAEPNTKADNGNPALSYAVGECTPGAIRALVKAGADMKTKNRAGLTAMALAVSDGRADNVKALLDLGYDVTAERAMLLQWSEGKPEIQRLLRGTASPKR